MRLSSTLIRGAAVAAASTFVLVGCSSASDSPSTDPAPIVTTLGTTTPADDLAALQSVAWDASGETPALEYDAFTISQSGSSLLVEDGDGAKLNVGDIASLSYVAVDTETKETLYSTYDTNGPEQITLNDQSFGPVLLDILVNAHVGARILYAVTDDSGTILMAITVDDARTPLTRAEGTAVAPVDGLPTVTLADNGAPSIKTVSGDAPTELIAQDLITGDGAVVNKGDTVTFHYSGWLWDGTSFDSSWDRGAAFTNTLADGALIKGWVDGLSGKTVGSQVLLVVPADWGYGANGQGSIPGGATLIFVVDILDTNG